MEKGGRLFYYQRPTIPKIPLPYFVKIHQLSWGGVFPMALINGQNSKKHVLKHFKFVYQVKLNPHNKDDGVYQIITPVSSVCHECQR